MRRLTTLLALGLGIAAPTTAQDDPLPVKVEARIEPAKAAPGSEVTLEVILQVDPGWHVYGTKETTSLPVAVKVSSSGELRLQGEPKIPEGNAKVAHGTTTYELTGKVVLQQKLKVPASLGAGPQTVKGKVSFMVCDEQRCLPPGEEEFTATLTVTGTDEGKAKAKAKGDSPVNVEARIEPGRAEADSQVTLEVILEVDPGWHVYGTREKTSLPVSFKLTSTGELRVQGEQQIPGGTPKVSHGATTFELTGKVVLKQVLKVPASLKDGAQTVTGKVAFMVCDETHCLPPAEEEFTATLTVGKGATPAPAGKDAGKTGLPDVKPGYVKAQARVEPANPAPGSEATLILTLNVEPGIHLYGSSDANPMSVTLLETGSLRAVGDPVVPSGEAHGDNFWLLDKIEVRQKLRVPADARGPQKVRARIKYLPCDESVCFEEGTVEAEAIAEVPGGSGAVANAPKAVSFTVRTEPSDPRPGEAVDVAVSVQLAKGVTVGGRADSKATTLTSKGAWIPVGSNRLPDGRRQQERHLIEGGFELRQALRVPEDAKAGSMELPFELTYQMQDADGLLVRTESMVAKVEVTQGAPRSEYLGAAVRVAEFGGLLGLLLAAIGAGLLALLMPCTYPMIPITISFFTKQASTRGGSVAPLAMAYGFGIVLIFILIGLFAAPVIVPFATHWLTNTVITAAFLFFAASLFGLVTLQPPKFLLNLAGAASQKGGYLGVFLMGATLVITSFTCTVPVAGALLSLTADGGGWYVIAGMAVFGLTMAVPFVLLSLLPGRLHSVPRAGAWMDTLKVFLGFVELAAAMKFASNVDIALHDGHPHWLKREPFLWIWVALFVGAGVYLLLPLLRGQVRLGVGRSIGILFSLLFAGYCGYGALGHPFPEGDPVMAALAPPATEEPSRHEIVRDNYDKAVLSAKEQGKLVLVNFTGFT